MSFGERLIEALLQMMDHVWINFEREDSAGPGEEVFGQLSCAWTDLNDPIGFADPRQVNDSPAELVIDQKVLPQRLLGVNYFLQRVLYYQ